MNAAPVRPALTLVALAAAGLAVAAAYEPPQTFKASQVLKPAQVKGPHFSVKPTVKTDGYLYVFDLTTDYGPLDAEGRSQLVTRIQEVSALAELDEVSKSAVFVKAAGTSVVNVGKGVASAVSDPGATAKGIGGGIKRFGTNLGRKADRAVDSATDKKDDDKKAEGQEKTTEQKATGVADSALGVNGAARKWAQKVGADPYTTNPILKKALVDLGRVDSAGGIAAKVVVPIPMVVSSTATVGNLVWAQDPEALLKRNEGLFRAIGVSNDVIKRLYLSKGFTLTTHTRLATAIGDLKVKGAADYVETAAGSGAEREAHFFVESAELAQRLHGKTPIVAILEDSRALVAKTGDGRAIVLLPLDYIPWTEALDKAATAVAERAKKELGATKLELHTTGTVSATAKKELAARGWALTENVPSTIDLIQAKAAAEPKKK